MDEKGCCMVSSNICKAGEKPVGCFLSNSLNCGTGSVISSAQQMHLRKQGHKQEVKEAIL